MTLLSRRTLLERVGGALVVGLAGTASARAQGAPHAVTVYKDPT